MKTFATSMAKYLEQNKYGAVGKNIFINNIPSSLSTKKELIISVYDTPSYAIVGRARNSVDFTCQIRVRASKAEQVLESINSIYKLLNKGLMIDPNGKRFHIKQVNPPQFLVYDESNRANWVLNITALSETY